jgi:TIR domain/NB-ARC domain
MCGISASERISVLRMQEATARANLTLAVLSEPYLQASYTQPEWAAAFAQDPNGKDRRLIPVRVGECALTGMLRSIICIDLINLREEEAERALLNGLKPSEEPARLPRFPGNRATLDVSGAPFPLNVARLYGVPDLPPHYLPREADLAGLKQRLLSGDASVAITCQGQALGLQGMGGIDKTVLAAALAHDSEVRQAFPDGIYWLTIGQKPSVLLLQGQLLQRLGVSEQCREVRTPCATR